MIFPAKESMLLTPCINACIAAGFSPKVAFTTNTPSLALEHIKKNNCVYWGADVPDRSFDPTYHHKIKLIDSPIVHYSFAWKRQKPLTLATKALITFLAQSSPLHPLP